MAAETLRASENEIREAQKADPVSIIINADVAEILYFARRYDEAREVENLRHVRIDDDGDRIGLLRFANLILARAQRFRGHYADAITAAGKGLDADPDRL